ncbi:unnamed protein product [Lampetra fluviatilis]
MTLRLSASLRVSLASQRSLRVPRERTPPRGRSGSLRQKPDAKRSREVTGCLPERQNTFSRDELLPPSAAWRARTLGPGARAGVEGRLSLKLLPRRLDLVSRTVGRGTPRSCTACALGSCYAVPLSL